MLRRAIAFVLLSTLLAVADPCPKCGHEVEREWRFCSHCGAAMPDKDKAVADAAGAAEDRRAELLEALRALQDACEAAGDEDRAEEIEEAIGKIRELKIGARAAAGAGTAPELSQRLEGRAALIAKNGGSEATEAAMDAGLRWLARHQAANGGWSSAGFDGRCHGEKCGGPGYADYDVGVTGLALLAFLGAGYTPRSTETWADEGGGKTIISGWVVRAGLDWLRGQQDAEGCLGGRSASKYMYNHAVAALALCEAYGLTKDARLRKPAQLAVDFIAAARNPYKAWRYTKLGGDNDTSVTGWCVMALKAGGIAGLKVDAEAYEGASAWIDGVTDADYSKVGYTARGTGKVVVQGKNEDWDGHESLTAIGMLCRLHIGRDRRDPHVEGGAKLLVADLPQNWGKRIDYYYWYHGSQALFQWDGPAGKYWKGWNEALKKAVVPLQVAKDGGCAAGSWDVDVDRWAFEGGRIYATAINVLTMETYYRYPPMKAKK